MEHSLVLKNANDPLGVPEKKCLLEGVSGTNLPLYFIMQQFFMLHFKILISTCKMLVSCKMQKGVHLRAVSGGTRASYFIFPQNKIQKCHMKPEYQALSPDLSMSILISSDSLLRNPRSVGTKRMRCFPALIACLLL